MKLLRGSIRVLSAGSKRATLTVRIDRPYPAEVQLQVQGNIRADLAFEPGVIKFGEVDENAKARKIIRVIHHGSQNWKIVDIKSTFRQIKVGLTQTYRAGGTVNYDMVVELQEEVPAGYLQGELFVETNEGRHIRYPITFTGIIVPSLQTSAETLAFGPLSPGEEVVQKVFVKAKKPFRITGVETTHPCLQVSAGNDSKKLQILEVKFKAGPNPGRHECVARIRTDLGTGQSTTIKAVATVEDNTSLSTNN